MPLWKPLLVMAPAGLALGAIGGQLARPEMTQHIGEETWRSPFQSRNGQSVAYPEQARDDLAYVGGYSYAPDLATTNAGWSPPDQGRWSYADAPLPTVAQLDARQAALLADPDVEFAVHRPPEAVEQPADGAQPPGDQTLQPSAQPGTTGPASGGPPETGPEPRKADGEPAIW